MKAPIVKTKNVLVTGASSGIGAATALYLREQGWNVLPTARKPDDLDNLRSQGFTPLNLDVAKSESVEKVAEETLKIFNGEIGGIVNNAGFGQPGAVEDLSRKTMQYQFEVNVVGLQDLTNRFIPVMRKQGWGRIVNVSSVVGRISLPIFGIYSASKFALEAVSDALRVELRESGVAVSIIEPGPIATEFGNNAVEKGKTALDFDKAAYGEAYRKYITEGHYEDKRRAPFTKPPVAVARKIHHALDSKHPRRRYPVTLPAYLGSFMRRFATYAFVDRILWKRQVRHYSG